MNRRAVSLLVLLASFPALAPRGADGQDFPLRRRKVMKTDREWARQLTHAQYLVCRHKATEPAFSGRYVHNHAKGVYACICCGARLFGSEAKFDSGTGWPSFWRPIKRAGIDSAPDLAGGEPRVEVMCNDCGAHLGHVFDDGPPPTGLRYCINSTSLKFIPDAREAEKGKARAKAGKGKARAKSGRQAAPDSEAKAGPAGGDAPPPAEGAAKP